MGATAIKKRKERYMTSPQEFYINKLRETQEHVKREVAEGRMTMADGIRKCLDAAAEYLKFSGMTEEEWVNYTYGYMGKTIN